METIKTYLDNMFRHLPNSPQVIRAKEELYTMMEDKYNELKALGKTENEAVGIVISEFGNIDEVAEGLGISSCIDTGDSKGPIRVVKLSEAKEYISETIRSSYMIALGVVLCICSPIALILLFGMEELNMYAMTEGTAGLVGLLTLALMIATAIGLFIFHGIKSEKYEMLEKEEFQLDYGVDSYVKQEKDAYAYKFAAKMTLGICLCILSVIPVVVAGLAFEDTFFMYGSVAMILAIVSIGVYIIITTATRQDTYDVLLQVNDFTKKNKNHDLNDTVASIYWPLIVVIYLAWSFTTNDWGRTWIVWPIAGVLFAVIANICNAIKGNKVA